MQWVYVYGMKYRGFSPGCQPMDGLIGREDDPTGKYHDLLLYNSLRSADEMKQYELESVGETVR